MQNREVGGLEMIRMPTPPPLNGGGNMKEANFAESETLHPVSGFVVLFSGEYEIELCVQGDLLFEKQITPH